MRWRSTSKGWNEAPIDIAKEEDIKTILKEWDIKVTEQLMEDRKRKIQKELESRITNAVEREVLQGSYSQRTGTTCKRKQVKEFRERMDELTMEAISNNERARGQPWQGTTEVIHY